MPPIYFLSLPLFILFCLAVYETRSMKAFKFYFFEIGFPVYTKKVHLNFTPKYRKVASQSIVNGWEYFNYKNDLILVRRKRFNIGVKSGWDLKFLVSLEGNVVRIIGKRSFFGTMLGISLYLSLLVVIFFIFKFNSFFILGVILFIIWGFLPIFLFYKLREFERVNIKTMLSGLIPLLEE